MPVIETQILLAGISNPAPDKVQISRWQKSGKLIQVRRGVYLLAQTYRKSEFYEPYLAGLLKRPSYISLEKALEHHGLIPEAVMVYTSVTTKRPGRFLSPVGTFDYRHIKDSLFWGYNSVTVNRQTAFFASPEKALLDLFYLKRVPASLEYLQELRIQNAGKIDLGKLVTYAERFQKPGIMEFVGILEKHVSSSAHKEKTL